MKTTEPTIGHQPLTGWATRLPTATLDLRGKHVKPTLAQKVATIRASELGEFEIRDGAGRLVWANGAKVG
jgi:hypothetical protein